MRGVGDVRVVYPEYLGSAAERIEQAKEDWHQQCFAKVPDETECIPMPMISGKPARYPHSSQNNQWLNAHFFLSAMKGSI
ncbi:hypothetical protein HG264_13325 [Pseudomonas sp. gcc21]|uniref:hypothetical protein n=1 Tax=Pseudomonas sp. gcc21 TaxID=2726989 RepID=UPI0014526BD9|nr:hypothetical protein [Pseudomonas sp. gcc21]QJD59815.1 hypothetical protein HG264_13325 [Pseudomonas sp. gcc21]